MFLYVFMFQLTKKEFENLRSQIVTSNWGGRRHLPYAFTEQGVAMLSSVLNSKRAIQVNIGIMRIFVNIRRLVSANKYSGDKYSGDTILNSLPGSLKSNLSA